jgi:RNA polymerase sigma factor
MQELDQNNSFDFSNMHNIDEFIARHDFYILKVASKTAKRYVSKSDEEYSIALLAFYETIQKYDEKKGNFYAFAELIISRSIIDYYRGQSKYKAEIQVEAIEDSHAEMHHDDHLKWEIEAIEQVLNEYNFTFMDLAKFSPKAKKTKYACKEAILFLLNSIELIEQMRNTKQLPVKIIEKKLNIPRKILERHRKYIIAAVEILHGEYPVISEYLSFVKEGENLR